MDTTIAVMERMQTVMWIMFGAGICIGLWIGIKIGRAVEKEEQESNANQNTQVG